MLFAVTRVIWINAVLLFGAGACMVMVFAVLSSLVQLIVPNEMRGRVMSIYMVAFRGGMPLGSLVAGYVATLASAPTVLTINGALLSLVAGVVSCSNARASGSSDAIERICYDPPVYRGDMFGIQSAPTSGDASSRNSSASPVKSRRGLAC